MPCDVSSALSFAHHCFGIVFALVVRLQGSSKSDSAAHAEAKEDTTSTSFPAALKHSEELVVKASSPTTTALSEMASLYASDVYYS